MSSRMIIRNRVAFASRDHDRLAVKRASKGLPTDTEGAVKDCTQGIAPTSPASPFRAGVGLWDREEKVTYRSVHHLNPLEGWAVTEFWQKRWEVDHASVVRFIEAGFIDAAVCLQSQVKKYRCRDEYRLKRSKFWRKARQRTAKRRSNAKRLRREQLAEREGTWG